MYIFNLLNIYYSFELLFMNTLTIDVLIKHITYIYDHKPIRHQLNLDKPIDT